MFWFSEKARRERFFRYFIATHYSTYRHDAAGMDQVCLDAQTAWDAIQGNKRPWTNYSSTPTTR